jgi:WD40-like Beta Propeller Repeat
VLASCQAQIKYPAPTIKSLNPSSIDAGQPAFILTVNGSSFTPASTVVWNGSQLSSLFVSTSQLTAQIPASDIQNAGTAQVSVLTPSPGGGTSLTLTFIINPAPSPVPQITSLSPSGVSTGSGQFTLNVRGNNFVSPSIVTVNGASRPTAFQNSTYLQATIFASDVATGGSLPIAVINPQPSGGSSNVFALSVTNPVPLISTVSPVTIQAGSAAAGLGVSGANFVPNSVVLLNGAPRTTAFTSSAQLSISLTVGDLAQGGVDQVQVQNPAPGGGTSNIATLAINATDAAGLPIIVDLAPDGSQANAGVCGATCSGVPTLATAGPAVSQSGQFVAFASTSTKLLANPTNGTSDIFLRDTCLGSSTCTPMTSRVNVAADGSVADAPSSEPSLDGSAAHVAYTSTASNLTNYVVVSGGKRQVYWQAPCLTGALCTTANAPVLISIDPLGNAGNGDSYSPAVSPDGQYVAFVSLATNLVSSVAVDGITPQVYIRDTCNVIPPATGTCVPTTYLVSTVDGLTPGDGPSAHPAIANDGLYVAFSSTATNFGATAPNPSAVQEVFVRSTCITTVSGCVVVTNLASTPDGVTDGDLASIEPAISSDGRFIAFASLATNLGVSAGGVQQIYEADACVGVATANPPTCSPFTAPKLVSSRDLTANPATTANALSQHPSINQCGAVTTTCHTGQLIAFSTQASNLGGLVQPGAENIFVRNTCEGVPTTTSCTPAIALASQPPGITPAPANGSSIMPAISGDGKVVGFLSAATNLVSTDTNALEDIFLAATSF